MADPTSLARVPERVSRLTLVLAILAAVLAGLGFTTQVDDSPIGPYYEDPTPEELALYDEALPCPPLFDWEMTERTVDVGSDGSVRCGYRTADGFNQAVTVRWMKADNPWYATSFCEGEAERRDDGSGRISNKFYDTTGHAISGEYSLNQVATAEATLQAAVETMMGTVVDYARTCAEPPAQLDCPDVPGLVIGVLGPGEVGDIQPDTYSQSCFYDAADPNVDGGLRIEVWWAARLGIPQLLDRLCNEFPMEGVGFGSLIADGIAANGSYLIRSPLVGPDRAVAVVAAQALLDQAVAVARSCEEAEVNPTTFQSFPQYLAPAFTPELTADPVTGDEMAPLPPTRGVGDSVADEGRVGSEGAGSERGLVQTLIRIGSVVMFALSILGLFITFLLVRRETRIRETRDMLRIGVTVAVAALSVLILGRHAPLWAILVAVGLGIALGTWQGSSLTVRSTERGLVGKRSLIAIIAFAAGVLLMQGAGFLNRSGGVALGIAVSFLSAAITAGLFIGRKPRMAEALGGAARTLLPLLLVAGLLGGFGVAIGNAQTEQPATPTGPLGSEGYQHLLDVVPWDTAFVSGGLWWADGKPPAPISLPRGLTTPPDPVTQTVSWATTDTADNQIAYEITETYSFGARVNGTCCTVSYEAAGASVTTRASNGEVTVETTDVSGRLEDISPLGTIRTGGPMGIPFSEVTLLRGFPEDSCQRTVARRQEDNDEGAAIWDSIRVNGEETGFASNEVTLFIGCDLPDFSYEDAFSLAPPVPGRNDPARTIGGFSEEICPVLQEFMRFVGEAGRFEGVATETLADLFLQPNAPLCDYGGLAGPPSFGEGGRGGTRHEIIYRLAILSDPVAEAARLADDGETFYMTSRLTSIHPHERCELGDDGVPLQPGDGSACRYISIHSIDESGLSPFRQTGDTVRVRNIAGGVVYIETDWDTSDGPNVTVRAHLPWGKYIYRCHHCTPGSKPVTEFISALHRFGSQRGSGGPDTVPEEAAPATDSTTTTEAEIDPNLTAEIEFTPAGEGEEGITEEEAGLIGLVGLVGSIGLLGASLQGTGLTAADVAAAVRRGDLTGGISDMPPEAPEDVPTEEDGEPPETSEDEPAEEEPAGGPAAEPAAQEQSDEHTGSGDGVPPAAPVEAGLVGLGAGARLIGQTLVEAGVPASEVMEAWREGGTQGVRDLAAARAALGGYPEPSSPPPPPSSDDAAEAVAESAELDDAFQGIPADEVDAVEAEIVRELDRERANRAVDAARVAVGAIPDGDLGDVLDRPDVQQALEGLTDDQRRAAVDDLIQQLTSERRDAAVDAARGALNIPVEDGPLAGQPRGEIGDLVGEDDGVHEALERLPDNEARTAIRQLTDDLTDARRAQATSEAIEAMTRAAAARDVERALDGGDVRTVREILDGLEPEAANSIWEEAQQGRSPIDLDAMEATQPPDETTRTPMTGVPEGDVFDAVNGNDQVREILEQLPPDEANVVRSRVVDEIGERRTRQVTAAAVAAARHEALVVSVRAATEAGDSDAVSDLLDGLDPTARADVLDAVEGVDVGSVAPPSSGGPSIPDADVGLDVDAALARPDVSDMFDPLPAREAAIAREAARVELDRIRRDALLRTAREAVEPRGDDVAWRDPFEAARGEGVRRTLDEARVPEGEAAGIQDELERQLQAEQRERLLGEARSALARDRAVDALHNARRAGDATGVDRILSGLSDEDREAVLSRFD